MPRLRPQDKPAGQLSLPDKPSIAVLPFANMSDHADQAFLAEGLVEDIITESIAKAIASSTVFAIPEATQGSFILSMASRKSSRSFPI